LRAENQELLQAIHEKTGGSSSSGTPAPPTTDDNGEVSPGTQLPQDGDDEQSGCLVQ